MMKYINIPRSEKTGLLGKVYSKMFVMLGDDLMGEYGLCITMFEDIE